METTSRLARRVGALEAAVPVDNCTRCSSLPVFTLAPENRCETGGSGADLAVEDSGRCPECGREPFVFSIEIDRLETRAGDAA